MRDRRDTASAAQLRYRRQSGWLLVGTGVAFLVGGLVVAAVVNNPCTEEDFVCINPASIAAGVGVAIAVPLVVWGAVLVGTSNSRLRRLRARPSVAVGRRGASLRLEGVF